MGRGFSGNAFARQFFALLLAAGLWASPAGAQQTPLGNGGATLGNGEKAAPVANPEVKSPAPAAAGEPEALEAKKAQTDAPKADDPKAKVKKPPQKAAPEAAATPAAAAAAAAAPTDGGTGSSSQILTPSIPTFGADGALRYSYGIDLPGFHGIEPEISLNYDSGRKTKLGAGYQGWLGFGWGLDGFDVIERQRAKGGVPAFDANDVYLLNGTELVACAVAAAGTPSCAAGGNYATEVESYQRIKYNMPSTSTWTVTQRDGTQLVFYPMDSFRTSAAVDSELAGYSKWYLRSVTDTHGNTVTYDYNCVDGTVCYPRTVIYGRYQVNFYYEERPDHILMANGRTISRTTHRIRTISVTANGAVNSAYALYYDQAPGSNNSRLKYVYHYGSDAVIDGTGTVAAGTSLPRVQFSYRDFNSGGSAYAAWEKSVASPCTDSSPAKDAKLADLNNDGADELALSNSSCGTSGGLRVDKFDFTSSLSVPTQTGGNGSTGGFLGNFLGAQANKSFIFETGTGSSSSSSSGSTYNYTANNIVTTFDQNLIPSRTMCSSPGSFAEDCASLQQSYSNYCSGSSTCSGSGNSRTGPFTVEINNETKLSRLPNASWTFAGSGDFNGGGVQRPVINWGRDTLSTEVYDAPYAPTLGGPSTFVTSQSIPNQDTTRLVDINGDGLTDIVHFWGADGNPAYVLNLSVHLSTGRSFVFTSAATQSTFTAYVTGGWYFADIDGDGRANVMTQSSALNTTTNTANYTARYFIFGASGNVLYSMTGFMIDYAPSLGSGDINGDGLPDFPVKITGGNYVKFLLSDGSDGLPHSLLSVRNELGGVHSFKFKPSTRYVNQFLPFAMSTVAEISADDGRGGVGVQKISYAGGKYDPVLRRFMGFRTVTETRSCAAAETSCPMTETTYRQDVASVGLPERVIVKDGAGIAHKEVSETYDIRLSSKPYFAKNTATTTILTEGNPATLKTERLFDAYGNAYDLRDHGRVDRLGDELRSYSYFSPNLTAYIVDKPYITFTAADFASGAPYLTYANNYYDSLAYGVPPSRGDVTRRIDLLDTSPRFTDVTMAYDGYGNLVSQTNALGEQTVLIYDSLFYLFVTEERDPLYATDARHKATALYDPVCGLRSEKTGSDGIRWTFLYDRLCRPYFQYNTVSGNYLYTYYNSFGAVGSQNVSTTRRTMGGILDTFSYFDGLGRAFREESTGETTGVAAQNVRVQTYYDVRGNVTFKSLPHLASNASPQYVATTYDWADRPLTVTLPDNSVRSDQYTLDYLNAGSSIVTNVPLSVMREIDELARTTYAFYTTRGDIYRTARSINGSFQSTYRRYDSLGRMTGVTDDVGATWFNVYDIQGNRVSATDPDLGTWTYSYDTANRLVSQTDARGYKTGLTYDKLGRLLTRRIVSPVVPDPLLTEITYDEPLAGYYNLGKLTKSRNAAATQVFAYDGDGALWYQATGDSSGWHYTYTTRKYGQILHKIYSPGPLNIGTDATPWTYDGAGRLKSMPGVIKSQTYEADGQTKKIVYENNVSTEFTYHASRRWVMRILTKSAAGVALIDNTYQRDASGRITQILALTEDGHWYHEYDSLDRLTRAHNYGDPSRQEYFAYDNADNMLSRTRVAGAYLYPTGTSARPHTPTSVAGRPFSYDSNGNLISDGLKSLNWSPDNRLAAVQISAGGALVYFSYGPDGARAKKVSALGTTRYFGPEAEEKGGVFTRFPHMDVMVQGGAISFLHRDHLATVKMVTNIAGTVTERTGYAAFGEPTPATSLPKGFIGERPDVETGLLYLNARYYDPALGRFISPDDWDPTLAGVGTNRYAYAGNDPVNKSDPNGHFFDAATAAKLATAGGFAAVDGPAPFGDIIAAGILLSMLGGDTPDYDREIEHRTAEYQRMGMSQALAQNSAADHVARSSGTRSDYNDHHMYPRSLGGHSLFAALVISIDDPANIVRLPTHSGVNSNSTVHCGCQNGVYKRARTRELDIIWNALRSGEINRGDARARLKAEMDRLRARHEQGTIMLNRASERAAAERAARQGSGSGEGSGGGSTSPRAEAAIRSGGGGLY